MVAVRLALTALVFMCASSLFAQEYVRSDWRHWIDEDKDCLNTRHEVLEQESLAPVTINPVGCYVTSGRWRCPYTGKVFTDPSKLDVDHLVPLRHAHDHGAAGWSKDRKGAYANDLAHPEHLVVVSASSNRSKGAQGPDAWKPPDRSHWCDYALYWTAVKTRWGLNFSAPEIIALQEMINSCAEELP